MEKAKQVIITEVGTFGGLNIQDPTMTEINGKKKKPNSEDVDRMIAEAITENANITI